MDELMKELNDRQAEWQAKAEAFKALRERRKAARREGKTHDASCFCAICMSRASRTGSRP
jgi:hypothetical protein